MKCAEQANPLSGLMVARGWGRVMGFLFGVMECSRNISDDYIILR